MKLPAEFGPKMARLTEKQRNYIKAQMSAPLANPTEWCRMAGYCDSTSAAKVQAYRMRHDPRIEEATLEYASHFMHRDGPILAVAVMMEIARNNKHPKQLAAAEAIADRVGLHRLSEHRVRVEHSEESAVAKAERIRMVAGLLGVDVSTLLGANTVGQPKDVTGDARVTRETKPEPKLIEHAPQAHRGKMEPEANGSGGD